MDQREEQKERRFSENKGKFSKIMGKCIYVIGIIGRWIYKLRSVILAIPVILGAVWLAVYNTRILPESVGILLMSSGEHKWVVARDIAVMGPLAVTALCLLMMFCSRRVLYPWIISIFSLVLPLLIWITNVFPA